MALNLGFLFFLLLSPFLADGVFQVNGGSRTGRNLLQATKIPLPQDATGSISITDSTKTHRSRACLYVSGCPVNFEYQNYTIITSKCKGPNFPASLCCAAFTEFACPFSQDLNDVSNNCASTMFSYINLYGKYPPGLFESECSADKKGLACDGSSNQTASANGGQGAKGKTVISLASTALVSGFGALLFY